MISRSVAQIATASMRTSTSARFGTGTGLSVNFSSPGSPSTHAFMVSGTGMSFDVFTPGGAYIRCLLKTRVNALMLLKTRVNALMLLKTRVNALMLLRRGVRTGLRARFSELRRKRAHRGYDLLAHQREMIVAGAHHRGGGADRADDGPVMVTDRGADANHAR